METRFITNTDIIYWVELDCFMNDLPIYKVESGWYLGSYKFGPYVKRGRTYQSLEQTDNVLTIDFDRAIALLSASKEKKEAVEIGKWNDKVITYQIGRYGPYVKWEKIMASVKNKNAVPTLEEAITLLQDKMHQK